MPSLICTVLLREETQTKLTIFRDSSISSKQFNTYLLISLVTRFTSCSGEICSKTSFGLDKLSTVGVFGHIVTIGIF